MTMLDGGAFDGAKAMDVRGRGTMTRYIGNRDVYEWMNFNNQHSTYHSKV